MVQKIVESAEELRMTVFYAVLRIVWMAVVAWE